MALKRPTGDALIAGVGERTGYVFGDAHLLETALTHASAVKAAASNERLEFLGDRVLGLVIADLLYRRFPDAAEGEIAPRFNALVDAKACAEVGMELDVEPLIRADSAVKARFRGKPSNYLADAVEALIAAIYLDGGMEPAQRFVLRFWEPRSHAVVSKPRNPKSELQEWLAKLRDVRPEYSIDRREGPDHQPVFTVSVSIDGFAPSSGTGRSRREAEEAAASAFLLREGVWTEEGAA